MRILPSLVFALNCSVSKATKAVPYSVVFGRQPTLPINFLFGTSTSTDNRDAIAPQDYSVEVGSSLRHTWESMRSSLQLSNKRDIAA